MASLPFAVPDDLGTWVGEDIPEADSRAAAMLMAASTAIQAEVGPEAVEAWSAVPEVVKSVAVQVAARVWWNPQGLVGDSIDDYSRRWDSSSASLGGVYLTASERDMLSQFRSRPKGLWTLGTTRGDEYADRYIDVTNADDGQRQEQMPFLPPGA